MRRGGGAAEGVCGVQGWGWEGEGKKGGRTVAGMHNLSQPLHSVVSVDADKYRIAVARWIGLD